jgi:RNA polymerase sigma-70 factor (ECF subfamily)
MALVKREAPPALVKTEDYSLGATTAQEQSYRNIYEMLFPRLCDFAERFLDREDARDVVQDAMRDIWERWPIVSAEERTIAFFFRAVRNQIAFYRRSEHRERLRLGRYLRRLTRRSHQRLLPDAQLEREELAAIIDATVAGMPERCREVWVLVRENELTYEQASHAMDVAPLTAKKHMTRAQRILRETLSDAGYRDAAAVQKKLPPGSSAEEGP